MLRLDIALEQMHWVEAVRALLDKEDGISFSLYDDHRQLEDL